MTGTQLKSAALRVPMHPAAPYVSLARHARLIWELCRRDVSGRYRGSMGGMFWAFLNPLLMLAIYSFVFGYIFKSRWTSAETGQVNFAIILFIGLIISNFFSECLNRAPVLITSNPNYVKKVIFPLETLSWVTVGTGLFHAFVSTIVLVVALVATGTTVAPAALLFPLLLLIFLPMVAGVTWLFSALGVYFRDTQQIMMVLTTSLVFLSPIFYPRTSLPEQYRWLQSFSPLTYVVETARGLILWNRLPAVDDTVAYLVASLLVSWLGWLVFNATRKGFADVI
ncbi:ABC transporter permease [Luteibacter aegosomatis]|uniref:ABC transporter permease n=1 Tax=Luteibacter aegosomatis TaxID=2911537 RepID=UPI001FF7F8C6|nr:ABC transporter permease [Luteibacter aegosomatis]UPG86529.1 ABC transporter permease [Luteibacter aegosomatis]